MNLININNYTIIDCCQTAIQIENEQAFMEKMFDLIYQYGSNRIILSDSNLPLNFFDLSSKVAGGILQKCITYDIKLAIISNYIDASPSLRDLIYELNSQNQISFVSSLEAAIASLSVVED